MIVKSYILFIIMRILKYFIQIALMIFKKNNECTTNNVLLFFVILQRFTVLINTCV